MKTLPFIKSFAKENGFIKFQQESFNNLIEERIQDIVNEIKSIEPEVPEIGKLEIRLGRISIGEPSVREADGTIRKILPSEARIRSFTYSSPVYVDMMVVVNGVEQESVPVHIGDLPIMLRSKYCPLNKMSDEQLIEAGEDPNDIGGYFIVNGTERILILLEEIAPNKIIVRKQNVGNYTEMLRINSVHRGYTQRHLIERKNDGKIFISFASIRRLPIGILLKALGMESDKDIMESLDADEDVINSFSTNIYEIDVQNSEEAVQKTGEHMKIEKKSYIKKRINQIMDRYLLPHLGQESKHKPKKAKYLALMIRKIIELGLGKIKEDDLDHYSNKRIRTSGDLLDMLLRYILIGRWGLVTRIKYNYQKMVKRGKLPPIQTIVEANVVTRQLISAMGTGSWTGGRNGVSQRLDRANYIKSLSHSRMSLSPLTPTQEHFEARELHSTNFGRFCPCETPEGPTIGLRKHLALFAEITKGLEKTEKKKLEKFIEKYTEKSEGNNTVILDGRIMGYSNPAIVKEIIKARREGKINKEVNVAFYEEIKEIVINSDNGRLRRPLIIVEEGKSKLSEDDIEKLENGEITFSDLEDNSILEFLDADEEDNMLVSIDETSIESETTHLEIAKQSILGLSSTLLPFAEFNRGDRVNFGAKMIGQAIGFYSSNYSIRADTKSNILIYPQAPIVQTETTPILGLSTHPAGQNIILAMMTHRGYNIEDGIIFNKSSIQRGMFRSMFNRVYGVEEKRYWGGQRDKICIPDKETRGYKTEEDYKNLAEDGIISPETPVSGNSVLVGKTSPMRFLSSSDLMGGIANIRETSATTRSTEKGVVDNVFRTETVDGNKLIKVIIRDLRIPEIGDKFASRHGQKAVIGLIVDERDMPFTSCGYTPDIIVNPHAIPSRQTVGQMLETLAGKTGALTGKKMDATPFNSIKEIKLRSMLHEVGFRSDGKEVLYNGITGEKYEVEIFVGINYYQKLDHMVANKIQSRSRGPVTLLTRQPTEGKAKEGGLRFGEMEKDCLIAHGAVLSLKERFSSDKIMVSICRICGITSRKDKKTGTNICPLCGGTDIGEVEMSYAFKLMLDELKTMVIYPKLSLSD